MQDNTEQKAAEVSAIKARVIHDVNGFHVQVHDLVLHYEKPFDAWSVFPNLESYQERDICSYHIDTKSFDDDYEWNIKTRPIVNIPARIKNPMRLEIFGKPKLFGGFHKGHGEIQSYVNESHHFTERAFGVTSFGWRTMSCRRGQDGQLFYETSNQGIYCTRPDCGETTYRLAYFDQVGHVRSVRFYRAVLDKIIWAVERAKPYEFVKLADAVLSNTI